MSELFSTRLGSSERKKVFKLFLKAYEESSYTESALEWFKLNVGEIVTSEELAQLTGKKGKPISHNIRRVFELRDEEGYEIINHKNDDSLKVDQWKLTDIQPNEKKIRARGVTKTISTNVFMRDNFQCQFCGRTPEHIDPFSEDRKIILHVGHIKPHKNNEFTILTIDEIDEEELTEDDFLTMCNVCNEGLKNNVIPEKLLSKVDRIFYLVDLLDVEDKKYLLNYIKNSL